ncbi:MAG: electron transfer flavoprotein subunit alpha/FixB family protein [Oligoflexia bacterium]|nr:electron transfer flavoprotein subunit alpha/FixB family protein [Oligoflexia bacterium]
MSNILFFLQLESGKIPKSTLCALNATHRIAKVWGKHSVHALCVGVGAQAAAEQATKLGFSKIYWSEASGFSKYLAHPYSQALLEAWKLSGADTLVCAGTSTGKDLAARVSGMLNAAQASDIIAVNDDGSLRRPMYAGNVIADVELASGPRVVTVRATAFAPAGPEGAVAVLEKLIFEPDLAKAGEVVGYEQSKSERPQLGDAETVVSGGRALQSAENFQKYIFPLADAFGAAVGASRAAVDSGYAPNDWQVGQTGKVVAPNLYVAVGISGAIQHLAGMKDSKVIVAINKDPEAPIFEVADYGLVGDLYQIVPELTEAVKKAKGN